MESVKVGIDFFDGVKFLVFVDEYGRIYKEKINNFLVNEEKINVFNEDNKQEWELEV